MILVFDKLRTDWRADYGVGTTSLLYSSIALPSRFTVDVGPAD